MERRVRIILAKLGLDDHSRPLYVLSQAFRDAGMEVIYLGMYQTPETVVNSAIQEGVDAIALSFHNLGHVGWLTEVVRLLKERGAEDICVFAGGIIPDEDKPLLEKIGVSGNFGPGTPIELITDHILERVRKERCHES